MMPTIVLMLLAVSAVADVSLVKQDSRAECRKGSSFGMDSSSTMYVDKGCAGRFSCNGKEVECESSNYRKKECSCGSGSSSSSGSSSDLKLEKQTSGAECKEGSSFGMESSSTMYVDKGCAGRFRCKGKEVECESSNYRKKECSCSGSSSSSGSSNNNDGSSPRSNFQVLLDGKWRGVCCKGSRPELSNSRCNWKESGRVLIDTTNKRELKCPEAGGKEVDCTCTTGNGERMHGWDGNVVTSIRQSNGAPIFPDIGKATCVKVISGDFETKKQSAGSSSSNWKNGKWDDGKTGCPHFRMRSSSRFSGAGLEVSGAPLTQLSLWAFGVVIFGCLFP